MKITQRLKQVLALTLVPDMGPIAFKNGLMAFGSLEGILGASASQWRGVPGLSRLDKKVLESAATSDQVEKEIEKAAKERTDIVTFFDEQYPPELKEIHDPPILFYVKGCLPDAKHPRIAVVGSRLASFYGLKMAEQVSRDLAASGAVVVSGLARGIDTAAHRGALSVKGITLAVQGCGLSRVYPTENKKLAQQIAESGALISEYAMTVPPQAKNFPIRNRIISGLSRAVLVAEARLKSGALITAETALEQGRDVYALPGQADSAKSQGSNALLKQGAHFITGAEDILQDYAMDFRTTQMARKRVRVTDEEKKLLRCLEGLEPQHLDVLIEKSEMSVSKAMGLLSVLTLKGAVQELPGKYFVGKE